MTKKLGDVAGCSLLIFIYIITPILIFILKPGILRNILLFISSLFFTYLIIGSIVEAIKKIFKL